MKWWSLYHTIQEDGVDLRLGETTLDLLKNLPYNSFKHSLCQNEYDYNENYNFILFLLQEHMTTKDEKPAQQIYKVQNREITGEILSDFQ